MTVLVGKDVSVGSSVADGVMVLVADGIGVLVLDCEILGESSFWVELPPHCVLVCHNED